MESFKVRQRIGQDGILHLKIPVGLVDRDVEVMVIYQPVKAEKVSGLTLDTLYGICADDPIHIDEAGISESLD
ncbi:MAG: hypothetical protein AAGD25_27030 [Cyanobacteria bacterium P01_F01_bin.150]